MKAILFLFLVLFTRDCFSQQVSAYSDSRKYFYSFDNGTYQQLEYLPVLSYKISGNSIAYVDNTHEFKIYYDGQVYKQDIYAADFRYYATACVVPFQLGRALYAFDRGQRTSLSYYASSFTAGDSIIAFFDETSPGLKIYENHSVFEAESTMLQNPRQVQSGGNLVAYVDPADYFKVYYHGVVTTLSEFPPLSFSAGTDILAYEDGYGQGFVAFYKGDTATLETFPPVSYKTGYGILAYVDQTNAFKVLAKGALQTINSYAPDAYEVNGNMVVYAMNNRFMVFYEGKETELENYIPRDYQVSMNGVAYKDVSGRLKFFWRGEMYTASYDVITEYRLNGDVLTYETGPTHTQFFFKGKSY